MAALANGIQGINDIDNFAATGWLPDKFFHLLQNFYIVYDSYMAYNNAASGFRIHCRAGCDRCCHQPVLELYSFEIINLYRQVRPLPDYEHIHKLFVEHAEEFKTGVKEFLEPGKSECLSDDPALEKTQLKLAIAGKPCPLLQDHRCRVYKYRPVSCRMLYSLTSPALCAAPEGKTFLLEPPPAVDNILRSLSNRFKISFNGNLATGLVQFAVERKFRPWAPNQQPPEMPSPPS